MSRTAEAVRCESVSCSELGGEAVHNVAFKLGSPPTLFPLVVHSNSCGRELNLGAPAQAGSLSVLTNLGKLRLKQQALVLRKKGKILNVSFGVVCSMYSGKWT